MWQNKPMLRNQFTIVLVISGCLDAAAALHRVLDVDSTAADSTQALDNVNLFRDEANECV